MKINLNIRHSVEILLRLERLSLVVSLASLFLGFSILESEADSGTWDLNPINNDWNTAANWSSDTVPGGLDTATFGVSNQTDIVVSGGGSVNNVVFSGGASSFQVFSPPGEFLVFGNGISNDSATSQNFVATVDDSGNSGAFQLNGGTIFGGAITFTAEAPTTPDGLSGVIFFIGTPNAGNATVVNSGGAVGGGSGGLTVFYNIATAGTAIIINEGGTVSDALGGMTLFAFGSADAGDSVITARGASINGAAGGITLFQGASDAANATLIAEGGANEGGGGTIQFEDSSKGGAAQVKVYGSGSLNIVRHNSTAVTIGSLEGDGNIILGRNLTIGSNNLSTVFGGVIQNTGTLTKSGTGTLTLTGANTYSGSTFVAQGALIAANTAGSATGMGALSVNAGTLGGDGTIAGTVTVGVGSGAGAFLTPAFGSDKQVTLTLQSTLTLQADATYNYSFRSKGKKFRADQVIAHTVNINGASINITGTATSGRLRRGTVLTVISNTSFNPISGTFSNLPDGAIITAGNNSFQASYSGGDGNDLTLTVVP